MAWSQSAISNLEEIIEVFDLMRKSEKRYLGVKVKACVES
jgi:hypothetical protein